MLTGKQIVRCYHEGCVLVVGVVGRDGLADQKERPCRFPSPVADEFICIGFREASAV